MKQEGRSSFQIGSVKTVKIIIIALIAACVILLLEPVQKLLLSVIREDTAHLLSLPFSALAILIFALCCLYSKNIASLLENPAYSRIILSLTAVAISLTVVFIGVFSYWGSHRWLDSDHASEMILGRILAEENALVSMNWRYSTELRLVYQTVFTMPLFKLLGQTENWALIRSLNIVLNNLVLIAAYIFMMRQFKVKLKWVFATCFFLIIPLSYEYWNIVTFGGYYTFFIAQQFLCLGLFVRLEDHKDSFKITQPAFILFILLSFVLGVQGIRAVYGIFIPLFASCILRKERKSVVSGGLALLGCCAGFLVNCLLQYIFSFYAFETMRIESAGNFFPKAGQCLVQLVCFFGIASGKPVLSAEGFFSITAVIGAFLLFRTALKSKHQFLPLFFIVSAAVNIFVFIISDKPVTARFFIPFMVLFIPLASLLFENTEKTHNYTKRTALIFAIIILIFAKGSLEYRNISLRDANSKRNGYINYLLDNELCFGFATFWNANVTTELTNGAIEIAAIESARGSNSRPFRMHSYLMPKWYYDPFYSEGESFLLLTRSEYDMIRGRSRSSSGFTVNYEDGNFIIIRFPSPEVIHREMLNE